MEPNSGNQFNSSDKMMIDNNPKLDYERLNKLVQANKKWQTDRYLASIGQRFYIPKKYMIQVKILKSQWKERRKRRKRKPKSSSKIHKANQFKTLCDLKFKALKIIARKFPQKSEQKMLKEDCYRICDLRDRITAELVAAVDQKQISKIIMNLPQSIPFTNIDDGSIDRVLYGKFTFQDLQKRWIREELNVLFDSNCTSEWSKKIPLSKRKIQTCLVFESFSDEEIQQAFYDVIDFKMSL
jgi:hypothetical protein